MVKSSNGRHVSVGLVPGGVWTGKALSSKVVYSLNHALSQILDNQQPYTTLSLTIKVVLEIEQ